MTVILTNPRERTRFLRFIVVGAFGAIVDFGFFNLLSQILRMNAVVASVMSFIAAIMNNFIWNRYWTYPDSRSKSASRQLAEFSLISIIGLAIRTPIFAALEGPLERLFFSVDLSFLSTFNSSFLGHNLALAIAVGVVLFWNFFINRYWTYSDIE